MNNRQKNWYENNQLDELKELLIDEAGYILDAQEKGCEVKAIELARITEAIAQCRQLDALESISFYLREISKGIDQ